MAFLCPPCIRGAVLSRCCATRSASLFQCRSHDRAADPDGSRRGLRRDSPSANPTSPLPHTALQRDSLGIGATPAVRE
jgi:hypothetical protein